MATLNTLRTRGGIIVSIVIGLALIAFLLGDLLSSGTGLMNARKMKVGEIDGTTIGYIEYTNRADLLTSVAQAMSGKDALTAEEQDQTRNLAWESMIMKYAYQPGFEELGLMAGEGEQVDMVSGVYISPIIGGTFVNRNGVFDPAMLKNFIDNVDADQSGRAAMMWNYMKEQMVDQRVMSKYVTLITKGLFVNDLEVELGLEAANHTYDARFVMQEYRTIPDSTVTVSDSELRSYYKSHKNMFKQIASRDIEYVMFDMLPSKEDYAEAEKYINELAAEFAASETPMQYATLNSAETPDNRYYKESQLEPAIAAVAFGGKEKMYGPVLKGDVYTLARLSEIRNLPDTIGAKHILLPGGETAKADSLVGVIRKGGDFAVLARENSLDENANMRGGDLGRFAPEQMIPQFSEACLKAKVGDIFTVQTQYGIHVVQLTYKSPLVPKAQMATITYRVDPSPLTQQTVYGEASKFLTAAAGSAENFEKAVQESALSKRVARIRNTDHSVNGIENSRELVRWAFNNDEGTVSPIMEVGGDYVVALQTGVREDGIAPVEQVASDIRTILLREKKGEMLAAKMKGASLDEVAASLGAPVDTVGNLQFGSFYVEGAGVEPRLIGAICGGAEPNTLSKPVIGGTGVFLFDVNHVTTTEDATFESEKVRLEAMAQAYINERTNQAMIEASEVKDWRVKFF